MSLSRSEISGGSCLLLKTANNIQQAAAYCSSNYLNSKNPKNAIDETINYATQSLGTMIHQINNLATGFLALLDKKTNGLAEVEEQVDKLSLELKIRQEKVSRKAIGSCAISKTLVKFCHSKQRIDPPQDYARRAIDYSVLDHVGHGIRSQTGRLRKKSEPLNGPYGDQILHSQTMSRRSSTACHPMLVPGMYDRQSSATDALTLGARSNVDYAASSISGGPQSRYQCGTLGRTAGIYRTNLLASQNVLPVTGQWSMQPAQFVQSLESQGQAIRSDSTSVYAAGFQNTHGQHPTAVNSSIANSRRSSSSSGARSQVAYCQRSNYAPGVQVSSVNAQPQINNETGSHSPSVPTNEQQTWMTRQSRVNSAMQAAAIDHLDSVVSMPLPPAPILDDAQSSPQIQPALAVDISRLQPSPMDQLRPRQSDDPPWAPNQYIQKVYTVYEYSADKNDELTFGENELIYVIKKNDDGWWEGVMNGNAGLFPGNYVEPID